MKNMGLAGKLAAGFINHALTLPITLLLILAGFVALQMTPREEEPQIVVPMVDIELAWPGHSAQEIEDRVIQPLETLLLKLPGMDYVYANSAEDGAAVIARFDVGYAEDSALIQTRQAIQECVPLWPADLGPVGSQVRSINDVPVFALTLYGKDDSVDALQLTDLARELAREFRREREVAQAEIIGDRNREVLLAWTPAKLASFGLTVSAIQSQVQAYLMRFPAGNVWQPGQGRAVVRFETPVDLAELANLPIQNDQGQWVVLGDIVQVQLQEAPLKHLAFFSDSEFQGRESVTLAVTKRMGANASTLTHRLTERVEAFRDLGLLPDGVGARVVRDYGETAKEKSDELIKHLLLATLSVVVLIALALGWRESLVVLMAVPVTLAMTLLLSHLLGFTINRVTLFALIFSIGILVDDAIVVVENIHRHSESKDGRPFLTRILEAVNEVGNPTILATFTVIAAILPMAMVGGLMGPYMLPIPILASLAMLFSLIVAFVVSPWAALRFMSSLRSHHEGEGKLNQLYRRFMNWLLRKRLAYWGFWMVTGLLFLAAVSLVPFKAVEVKMLPFDNKNEVQVVIDLPEGSSLAETARVALMAQERLMGDPAVASVQTYVGTAAPITFNGLVRHYNWRNSENQADLAVELTDRHKRSAQSHDLAKQIRGLLQGIGHEEQANLKVVEIPPGPPVLSTIVAELYGPDRQTLRQLAGQVEAQMRLVPGVVDVDTFEAAEHTHISVVPDPQAMQRLNVSPGAIAREMAILANGTLGGLPLPDDRNGIPIRLGYPRELEQQAELIYQTPVSSRDGLVELSQVAQIGNEPEGPNLFRKNGQQLVYVVAEVAGQIESPVYALGQLEQKIQALAKDMGLAELPVFHTAQPPDGEIYSLKWDGEWHITVEVFRDMGLAFGAVVILIYFLVVGWFRSLTLPLVILSPIPLSLVGILPGHWLFGAFFTATSMIGFIAGAGIIVRNSIILVDFIQQLRREGVSIDEAVVNAGVIRFKPMLLTAAAVMVGSSVILFDPIFQGLALSLMMGEIAATLLSRFAVPLLFVGMTRLGFTFKP
ncbi:MAG: efflux RND transporter permease subunit [Acidobacteria bacterium]|nr:efflux RND transporter permease subunit [Acidobacteriota bacterium]